MLFLLTTLFFCSSLGGILTTSPFLFSETVTSNKQCGWAISDGILDHPDKAGTTNNGRYIIDDPPEDGVTGRLPFNLLTLNDYSMGCNKEDFIGSASNDKAVYYSCRSNENFRARLFNRIKGGDGPGQRCNEDPTDEDNQDQWDTPGNDRFWQCPPVPNTESDEYFCTAQIEYEIFDNNDCQLNNYDQSLRYHVPIDTCIKYDDNNYYEFRCGDRNGDGTGTFDCDADRYGLDSGGCSPTITLWKFSTSSTCDSSVETPTFVIGYESDSSTECTNYMDGSNSMSYQIEVDCPV